MAKTPPPPSGRSKFRVLLVEGDLASGDMQQFASALADAMRPTQVIARPAAPAARIGAPANGKRQSDENGELFEEIAADEVEQAEDTEEDAEAPAPRAPRNRKYRVPKVLSTIDLDTATSWPDFVAEKKPSDSLPERYLTAAAWFKWHRKTDAIGIDHVYTCFLHPKVKWSTVIDDYDKTFRYHTRRDRMSRSGKGLYAINQIGLGEVDEFATNKAG